MGITPLKPVDTLSQSDAGDINASTLNRPILQLRDNILLLQQELNSLVGNSNIQLGVKCSSAVSVGSPVSWAMTGTELELALAGSKPCVGLCIAKHGDTLCDIQVGGFIASVDMTESAGVANPPVGLYYLSQTTPGTVSSVRPATGVQHPIFYSNGQGGIYLYNSGEYLPIPGPQGIQGIPGSTGATGAQGATGATGPAALPAMAAGRWYTGPLSYSPNGVNSNLPGNQLIAVPFSAPGGVTLSELGIKILSAGNPGDEGKLGIYADSNNYPGALITAANGVFNGGSAGPKTISIADTVIAPGRLVWLTILANSSQMGLYSTPREAAWAFMGWGNGFMDPVLGYMIDYTYGALPSTFPPSANELTAVIPTVFAKVK